MEDKKIDPATIGAGAAGAGSLALMGTDVRPKAKIKDLPHFEKEEVGKYVKPGDVLIGGPTTPDEATHDLISEWKKGYKQARKTKGIIASLKESIKGSNIATPISKMVNPKLSHAEHVLDTDTTAFMGGEITDPLHAASHGKGSHYVIMRPTKKGSTSFLPRNVEKIYTKNLIDKKNYDLKGAAKSGVLDFILPKFTRKEKTKSKEILAAEKKCTKGSCGTLPALASRRTIGGKMASNILPADYLRSKEWTPVGTLGAIRPSEMKSKLVNRIIYGAPKHLVRGAVAAGIAGTAYGALKLKEALMDKKSALAKISQEAMADELSRPMQDSDEKEIGHDIEVPDAGTPIKMPMGSQIRTPKTPIV